MPIRDKEKKREYQKDWMRKRRASFFNGKECKHCGSKENLELHHLNPEEKESHAIWSWRESRRNEEIAKCIVLCEKCHMEETKKYLKVFSARNKPKNTKVTDEVMEEIKSLMSRGVRGKELYSRFPIHKTNIRRAINRMQYQNAG